MRYPLVSVRGRYDTTHTLRARRPGARRQGRQRRVRDLRARRRQHADARRPRFRRARRRAARAPTIPPPPAGEQQLLALYAPPPGSGLRLGGNALPRQTSWPKQSIYLDVGEVGADLGRPLDAKILLLAPEQGSGFVREWRPDVFPPERHRGYAFTWFTLAAVVVGVFIGMHWRKEPIDMTPDNRKRLGLILIVALFAAPIVIAYLLNAAGWRPSGMRNYGTLIEPPQDLTAARFVLDDGKPLAWKDDDWSWTLFALTGPDCAKKCLARIDELRRARLTLNQNAHRVRVVVLDATLAARRARAARSRCSARAMPTRNSPTCAPRQPDDVAAVLVDPHGFLILSYPAGYDGNLLRKDLARLIKG